MPNITGHGYLSSNIGIGFKKVMSVGLRCIIGRYSSSNIGIGFKKVMSVGFRCIIGYYRPPVFVFKYRYRFQKSDVGRSL